jgi:glycosyltransferase involved in cell wall biosynthesis
MRCADVLIPFHSTNEFLWDALDSILDTRGVSVRLLLINDIEDESEASEFQKRLEHHLNLTKATFLIIRNKGRSYATSLNSCRNYIESDFVAILNSDDLSTPCRLQLQIQALEDSGAEIAVGQIVKFHGKFQLPSISGYLSPSNLKWHHLLIGAYGADASLVATKRIWLEHFRFDEFSRSSDWATALKVYPLLKIVGVDKAIYKYRIHDQQVTQSSRQLSDNFLSYFPDWVKLNTLLDLPEVSPNVARALSQPWAKQKLHKRDFEMMQAWCLEFEKILLEGSESSETKSLLGRRLIISGPIIFSVTQKPLLLTKMVCEYVYIRIIGSRARF